MKKLLLLLIIPFLCQNVYSQKDKNAAIVAGVGAVVGAIVAHEQMEELLEQAAFDYLLAHHPEYKQFRLKLLNTFNKKSFKDNGAGSITAFKLIQLHNGLLTDKRSVLLCFGNHGFITEYGINMQKTKWIIYSTEEWDNLFAFFSNMTSPCEEIKSPNRVPIYSEYTKSSNRNPTDVPDCGKRPKKPPRNLETQTKDDYRNSKKYKEYKKLKEAWDACISPLNNSQIIVNNQDTENVDGLVTIRNISPNEIGSIKDFKYKKTGETVSISDVVYQRDGLYYKNKNIYPFFSVGTGNNGDDYIIKNYSDYEIIFANEGKLGFYNKELEGSILMSTNLLRKIHRFLHFNETTDKNKPQM